ncbi:MAG: type I methionyl aminopeptidase [Clostridia bacterium]
MVSIKNDEEIVKMRIASSIVYETLEYLKTLVCVSVSTAELNRAADEFIRSKGAIPGFLNYNGFPASICISVNDEVVHGIPGKRKLQDGDIVSLDVGAYIDGFHGDGARTYLVGNVDQKVQQLVKVTKECFFKGIEQAVQGNHIADISLAIENHAKSFGYGVVRALVGHGIGRKLHEAPEVPNFCDRRMGRGIKLLSGMTIAVEPMINLGSGEVFTDRDNGWTVHTIDNAPSAHYENTILITESAPVILTAPLEE